MAIYREWDEVQEAILEEVVGIEEEVRMLTIYSKIIILEIPSSCVNNNYINDLFQADEATCTFKHQLIADHQK